jgi:peptidoglycan DL-endopeptidase CwlO
MTARPSRRWLILALATLVTAGLVGTPVSPASAAPGTSPDTAEEADDTRLNDVLESTGRRFTEAKNAVAKSTKNQLNLSLQVKTAEAKRDKLIPEVNAVAAQQYRTGRITTFGFMLDTNSPTGFLDKAVSLEEINNRNDHKLRELNAAIDEVASAKAKLDAEVKAQKQNLAAMAKQKESAEDALALVGGNVVTKGLVDTKSAIADPAPRNADGDYGPLPCTVDDPTTNGCITARTLHMYKQVKKAGFNRFVGCHRDGGPFEHPKGRACDWSLEKSGFRVYHNQDTFQYGNDLMAFLVRNADRLGILYVIWNRMIWFPATGWKTYHGPSTHEDHVHVSML